MIRHSKELILRWGRNYLDPFVLFDNVFPVLYSSRAVSASMHGSIKGGSYDQAVEQSQNREYRAMEDIMRDFGIDVTMGAEVHLSGSKIHGKVYFHRGRFDDIADVEDLQRKASESVIEGHVSDVCYEAYREGGKLLGYPQCCVEKTMESNVGQMAMLENTGKLGKGYDGTFPPDIKDLDVYIIDQLKEIFGHEKVNFTRAIQLLREKKSGLRSAYFAKSFYPCSTGCQEASKVGRGIMEGFKGDDQDLASFYDQTFFPSNIMWLRSHYSDDPDVECSHVTEKKTVMMYFDGIAEMLGVQLPKLPEIGVLPQPSRRYGVSIKIMNADTGEVIDLEDLASQIISEMMQPEPEIPPIHEFIKRLRRDGPDAGFI